MIVLTAKNIDKSYGDLQVLNNVSLEIQKSEVVAITGKSGAGKSTLLHILGTLDNPDKGEINFNGIYPFNFSNKKMAEFRNKHIGFVFQFHHLLAEFSALNNVMLPALIQKNNYEEAEKRAKELLHFLGLKARYQHKPNQLSGGEQQRVAFARALINNPQIIFADEPSGNLDSHTSEQLHQLIFNLRDEFGQSFILVTHNSLLTEMCDREIKLLDGEITN